jgi:hypothetical protein
MKAHASLKRRLTFNVVSNFMSQRLERSTWCFAFETNFSKQKIASKIWNIIESFVWEKNVSISHLWNKIIVLSIF